MLPTHIYCPADHVFLNGACHWYTRAYSFLDESQDFILSFDTNTDVYGRLKFPDPLKYKARSGYRLLRNLNECLAVVRHLPDDRSVEVWVMREYGVEESQTKQVV